ncbi:type III toxin-antitoxin system like protein [Leptotrichia trevisanii]|uniref:Type III toxin-antitoxin system like protein n=1 Tax=Leptotrichia trevisanii TaxID=109328 RepID=A0A510KWR0_9FUSO|nr:type III toxin-antitoxin system ToxN/AbiQ family toxin [Leptotrichia trevisanii]BBM51094.1 type III toxin-antitoxin system like protein [Leptotrichia trevisanii]BBM56094.1 type III toxin-antitoxin system like protein [Leptotrichia trevisanii]
MKLYEISDSYLDYLKSFDDRVLNRLGEKYRHTRKYLGILLKINDCDYIAPLSSPSQTDYLNGAIRKSIIPIVRIIKSKSGETTLLGKIKLSSMVPVYDKSVIKEYDINHEIDTKYKNLVFDQLDFINSNKKLIIKYANTLYRQKIKNFSIGYVNQTVNFLLLEEKSKLYNK